MIERDFQRGKRDDGGKVAWRLNEKKCTCLDVVIDVQPLDDDLELPLLSNSFKFITVCNK